MEGYFSKADFILFRKCPEELWLSRNRPELMPPITDDDLHNIEQGKQVDAFARLLFKEDAFLTQQGLQTAEIFFQRRVECGNLIAIPDILVKMADGRWMLFEVKAATAVKDELTDDIAFQQVVLEEAGHAIANSFLVHVNKAYVRDGDFRVMDLLTVSDTTYLVRQKLAEVRVGMRDAIAYINGEEPPIRIPFSCNKKTECPFFQYHYPEIPGYSVFDVTRLHRNKLKQLTDAGIFDIRHIPDDFPLSKKQQLQVDLAKSGRVINDRDAIRSVLSELKYPLYFLDYETFSYVIPSQSGIRPYQQLVFQYSLHVRETEGSELKHYEYLLREKSEPVLNLVKDLYRNIDASKGTVIVWHDSFEKSRNREMAEMCPEYADFFQALNDRIFDLEDIFEQHLYSTFVFHYSVSDIQPN